MKMAAAAVAVGVLAGPALARRDEQFAPPPGLPTDDELVLLREAVEAARKSSASDLVRSSRFASLHPQPVFRQLVRAVARGPDLTIAADDEPGPRIAAMGVVKDDFGRPIPGAIMYAYHTSEKGWYSDKAAHIRAWAGDSRHARLFGYLRTGADGSFTIHTIRPGGYPRSDLPQHIHIEVDADGFEPRVTELLFDDDPRLTKAQRERAARDGFVIAAGSAGADGAAVFRYEVILKKA